MNREARATNKTYELVEEEGKKGFSISLNSNNEYKKKTNNIIYIVCQ
jgi:hypothetical protein